MKINNIERVVYDLVTLEDGTLLRRSLDGQWEMSMEDEEIGQWWMDMALDHPDVIAHEARYQQEKPSARPTMGQMTEEHIVALAKHWLDMADSEISGVAKGDGWICLYWTEGTVFVNDDQIVFSTSAHGTQESNPSIHLLRLIASWGYDVMKEDER
jgi:hypothetical protein